MSMHVGPELVHVVLQSKFDGTVCMTADRIGFFVAQRRLVGLAFGPLLPTEREDLIGILGA